jgi:sarcosine oxidase
MTSTYDAIVIGLGAMGSAVAAHLAARGRRVLGLEQFHPAHDRGSSHGETRMIRQAYFEDPAYVPLVLRAYELWRDLEHRSGHALLSVTGGLMVGPPDSRTVAGSRESAEHWGLPYEMLEPAELRRRFPAFAPGGWAVGLHEPEAGVVLAEPAVRAQLAWARQAGAELRFGQAVTGWEALGSGHGVEVRAGSSRWEAASLVLCPGPWAPQVLAGLGVPFRVERQVLYWFRPAGDMETYRTGRLPCWVWEDQGGAQVYGFPSLDGQTVKVAFFRGGETCDPATIDRRVTAEEVARLARAVNEVAPGMAAQHVRSVTCMYTNTPDQQFVIGPHPGHEQVVVACGFSGHGFKFAPVVGEIVADLVTAGSTSHAIALFDPNRPHKPAVA